MALLLAAKYLLTVCFKNSLLELSCEKSILLKNSYGVAEEQAVDLLFPENRLFEVEMMILALERLG
jgi:hypothetical protein